MKIFEKDGLYRLEKAGVDIGQAQLAATAAGGAFGPVWIDPAWRRRGYGTYLVRELLRRTGGFARSAETLHTAPLPCGAGAAGELAFWAKLGFEPQGAQLVRRRVPDLTAVKLAQDFVGGQLAMLPTAPVCVDAICGNGHDTAFLCAACAAWAAAHPEQPARWQVTGMDIQPQAVANTRARLAGLGYGEPQAQVQCGDHAALLAALPPRSADAVLFNFGWLPGADHEVFSTAESSIPALEAALAALRPGGVLSAVLYSGKVIGSDEKQAVLRWLRALPLTEYTVLVCEFANWADTAPLPCLVLKK